MLKAISAINKTFMFTKKSFDKKDKKMERASKAKPLRPLCGKLKSKWLRRKEAGITCA